MSVPAISVGLLVSGARHQAFRPQWIREEIEIVVARWMLLDTWPLAGSFAEVVHLARIPCRPVRRTPNVEVRIRRDGLVFEGGLVESHLFSEIAVKHVGCPNIIKNVGDDLIPVVAIF